VEAIGRQAEEMVYVKKTMTKLVGELLDSPSDELYIYSQIGIGRRQGYRTILEVQTNC